MAAYVTTPTSYSAFEDTDEVSFRYKIGDNGVLTIESHGAGKHAVEVQFSPSGWLSVRATPREIPPVKAVVF